MLNPGDITNGRDEDDRHNGDRHDDDRHDDGRYHDDHHDHDRHDDDRHDDDRHDDGRRDDGHHDDYRHDDVADPTSTFGDITPDDALSTPAGVAVDLAERGWYVFPLHLPRNGTCSCGDATCKNPGKHPLGRLVPHGLKDASCDPDVVRGWWTKEPDANIGIATEPSGLVVVDVDPRHGGDKSLIALQRDIGCELATTRVRTGGRGDHYYFQANAARIKSRNSLPGYSGIDVKAMGGYVVAAGSLHISGQRYAWANSNAPQPIPGALLALLTAEPARSVHAQPTAAPGAKIPRGQRNAALTSQAGVLRRAGLPETEINGALQVMNRERCDPPLPESEVLSIAASIGRYPAGNSNVQPSWAPVSLNDALRAKPEPVRWVIEGLVPHVITLIHSQPREWKTLIALCLALSKATGRAAFDLARLSVPSPAPVFYITEEDRLAHVTTRLQQFCAGHGFDPPVNLFLSACVGLSLDDPAWQDRVIAAVHDVGADFVILDPLRSLSACVDQGPRELRPLTLYLRRLQRETDAAILCIHHDQKPQAGQADTRRRPQRASGGGVFSIADAPIGIESLADGRRMLVPEAFKFGADPAPVVLSLEFGEDWLRLVGEETATGAASAGLETEVLRFLEHASCAFGSGVARGIGRNKSAVLGALKALLNAGLVDALIEPRGTRWVLKRIAGSEPLSEPDKGHQQGG